MEEAFKLGLRVREQWIKAKSKNTLEQTFETIVCATPRKLNRSTPVAVLTRDFVRDLRAAWLKEPGKREKTTLSASTINHRLSMLSVLLEVCDLPPHTVKHLSTKGNARHRRIPDSEFAQMTEWTAEHLVPWLTAKIESLHTAQTANNLVAALEDPQWQIAAAARVGSMYSSSV